MSPFHGSSGLYLVSSFKNDLFTQSLQSHTHTLVNLQSS